jgi:hypothetical protein
MIIISEHGSSDGSITFGKKERTSITLGEEVDLKKRHEGKERKAGVACVAGIPESALMNLVRPKHAVSVIKIVSQNATM